MKTSLQIMLVSLFLSASVAQAQTYTFSTFNETFQPLTGATALHTNDNGNWWDEAIGTLPIGFNFDFFGTTLASFEFFDAYLSNVPEPNEDWAINPFGVEIWGDGTPVSYTLEGTAGSRIHKVEWLEIFFGK